MPPIRKAVIPSAGLGTRFLPVTKSQPKEFLPILGKPLIHLVVEEAVAAGIDTIVLVVSERKAALETYFHSDPELERWLDAHGKKDEAERLRKVASLADVRSVRQPEPLGLGHAIGCARAAVGDEPFAILLPDVLFRSDTPCIAQLVQIFASRSASVVGVREINPEECHRYGVVSGQQVDNAPGRAVLRVNSVVEKPAPADAPSRYGVIGRYVLQPAIFDCIDRASRDSHGEIQFATALTAYAQQCPLLAAQIEGTEFDAGDRLGFVKATVAYTLQDSELGPPFRRYLEQLRLGDT